MVVEPFGLNALNKFTQVIINSVRVEDTKPLSSVIVGLPDSGKTEVLVQYDGCKSIFFATDITGYGLASLLNKIQAGEIKYIVIPDLSRVIEGRGKAGNALVNALNSLSEEGVYSIATYNTRFSSEKPIRCGFITALTITSFGKSKDYWANLGFLSRTVPFMLGYTDEDVLRALDSIKNNRKVFEKVKDLGLGDRIDVQISKEHKDLLEKIALHIAKLNSDATAFRSYKNLITFAKSHSILQKRNEVTEADIKFIKSIIPFWFAPSGNDCEYYILQNLPNKVGDIIEALKDSYSQETVFTHLQTLARKGLIKSEGESWKTVI